MNKRHFYVRRYKKQEETVHFIPILIILFILWGIKTSMIIFLVVQPNSNYEVPTHLNQILYKLYNFLTISYLPQLLIIPCILIKFKVNAVLITAITCMVFSFIKLVDYPNDGYFYYNLNIDLDRNIYGQDNAIKNLIRLLEYPKASESSKELQSGLQVIVLAGGPGTGKSYIASFIKKHYSAKHTVTQIIPQIESMSDENLFRTQKKLLEINSGFGLIIIDSVKLNDELISNYLNQLSIFCKKYESDIFVILIIETLKIYSYDDNIGADHFKTKEDYFNFINKKTVEFEKKTLKPIPNISYNSVVLEPLTMTDAEKCIDANAISTLNIAKVQSKNIDFVLGGCKEIQYMEI